jgi:hypothetical protein
MDNNLLDDSQGREQQDAYRIDVNQDRQPAKEPLLDSPERNVNKVDSEFATAQKDVSQNIENVLKNLANPAQTEQLDEIEEKIDEFVGYTILIWIVWLIHVFNLGYFLFAVLEDYSQNGLQDYVAVGIVWNLLRIITYWEAFRAKEDMNITRQKIFMYGILLCYLLFALAIAVFFKVMFYLDSIYYASTGVAFIPIINSNKMIIMYVLVLVLELIIPGYLYWRGTQVQKLLKQRAELFQVIESQRQSLLKTL